MSNIISVSSAPLVALSANYPYDTKLDLQPVTYQFHDGYIFIHNPLMDGLKDIKFGNDSCFFVTSAAHWANFIIDFSVYVDIFDYALFTTLQASNKLYITNIDDTLYATGTFSNRNNFFRFLKNSDNTISLSIGDKYVTVNRYAPWNLTLESKDPNDTYNQQKFNFYSHNDKIYISTLFTNPYVYGPSVIERFISYSPVDSTVRAIGMIDDDDYVNSNNYLMTIGLYISGFNTGFDGSVNWVKYYNDFVDKSYNKNVDIKQSIKNIKQNFLVDYPYKTKINVNNINNTSIKSGTFNINIANLKNIMTPEYEYTNAPYISGNTALSSVNTANAVKRREYDQLFLGTNQDVGYENPFLGYTSNTKQQTFQVDKVTYFHYPKSAPQVDIINAGLVESGAVAGSSPVRADKIWKKNANYKRNIWWGNSKSWQRGTWLCTWLSGSENGITDTKPVWKDRWYFPGYVTTQQAGSAAGTIYVSNTAAVVWDEDSVMTFDPGVWYKYYHKGNIGNQNIVKTLTGDGTALKLHLKNWSKTTKDLSPYDNDGILQPYNNSMISNNVLTLNGNKQECFVPYSSTYNLNGSFSTSFWAYANDWNNIKGNNIVDNNFRGGWSIGYTNGFFNPILPIYDEFYGHILFVNLDGEIYFDRLIPTVSSVQNVDTGFGFGKPSIITVDRNLYTWVADNGSPSISQQKYLYKVDFNGDIISQIDFNNDVNLQDVKIDGNNDLWILDTDHSSISCLDTFGNILSTSIIKPAIYYSFNGNVKDQTPNNLDTNLSGNTPRLTPDRFGNLNNAYYFNGNDQYMDTFIDPVVNLSAVSYSYWFTVDDTTRIDNIYSVIRSYESNPSDPTSSGLNPDSNYNRRGYSQIDPSTKKLQVWRQTWSGPAIPEQTSLESTTQIQNNTWYHAVEIWDRINGKAKLFINGVQESSATIGMISTKVNTITANSYWQNGLVTLNITTANSGTIFTDNILPYTNQQIMPLSSSPPIPFSLVLVGRAAAGSPPGALTAVFTETAIPGELSGTTIANASGVFSHTNPGTYTLNTQTTAITAGTIIPYGSIYAPDYGPAVDERYLWLGRHKRALSTWKDHKGKIDDFMMFDYALNDDEAVDLYSGYYMLSTDSNIQHIDIDAQNVVRGLNCTNMCINNNDNIFWISGSDIYKDKDLVFSGIDITNIACDRNGYVWLLNDNTKFTKLSCDGSFILSGSVSNNDILCARSINFTNEFINNSYVDYIWIVQAADQYAYKYDTNGNYVSKIDLPYGIDISQYLNHKKPLMSFNAYGDFTGYDWYRKFKYLANDKLPHIEFNLTLGNKYTPSANITLKHPTSALSQKDWHHFTATYNAPSGICRFYVDCNVRDKEIITPNSQIYYEYKNGLIVGGNNGKFQNLDDELLTNNYHFKGKIDDLRIYDWSLNNSDICHIYMLKLDFSNMDWNMPTGLQSYIEEIERFFKHKLPGNKSQFFNIKIVGLNITDKEIKKTIENIIRKTINKISPAYTELYKIIWE